MLHIIYYIWYAACNMQADNSEIHAFPFENLTVI